MNIQDKYKIINEFEKKCKRLNLKYKSIPIWPLLRQDVLINIEDGWQGYATNDVKDIFHKIKLRFSLLINFFFKNLPKLSVSLYNFSKLLLGVDKVDVLFLSGTNAKRIKIDNKFYDIFCDTIIDELNSGKKNREYTLLDSSNEYSYKSPTYSKSVNIQLILHLSQFFSFVVSIIGFVIKQKNIIDLLDELFDFLRQNGITLKKKSYFSLLFELNHVFFLSLIFNRIIQKSGIKLTFIVSFYGPQGMALCLASSKNDIHSVDIQHGVHGKYHYAYSNIVHTVSYFPEVFPSEFWVWGKEDFLNLNVSLKKSSIKITQTGNLFLAKYFNELKYNNTIVSNYLKKHNMSGKIIILYTFDIIPVVPNIVLPLLNNPKYHWFFRFHPRTENNKKEEIITAFTIRENIEFYLSNTQNLYSLLSNSTFHITGISSVVIEATFFNVKSIVVSKLGAIYYDNLITSGDVFFCKSTDEIIHVFENTHNNLKKEKDTMMPFFDISKYLDKFFSK